MEVMALILVVLFLAFLDESMVEFSLGVLFDKVPVLQPYKWMLMYVALGGGVALALVYNLDLVAQLAASLNIPIPETIAGKILTGLAIGRGSNYINDIRDKFFSTKPAAPSA